MSQSPHLRTRLEIELEFVQCLANPDYLNHLASTKVLDDERFIEYIKYLEYWRKPEYAKLLTYPTYSLAALTLLQHPSFRADMQYPQLAGTIRYDMYSRYVPETEETEPIDLKSAVTANGVNGEQTNGVKIA